MNESHVMATIEQLPLATTEHEGSFFDRDSLRAAITEITDRYSEILAAGQVDDGHGTGIFTENVALLTGLVLTDGGWWVAASNG